MPFLITSAKGRLFLDEEMKDQILPILQSPAGVKKGCLAIDASIKNILSVCNNFLWEYQMLLRTWLKTFNRTRLSCKMHPQWILESLECP